MVRIVSLLTHLKDVLQSAHISWMTRCFWEIKNKNLEEGYNSALILVVLCNSRGGNEICAT